MRHSPSSFEVSKPSLAGISRCVQENSSTPGRRGLHSNLISCCYRSARWLLQSLAHMPSDPEPVSPPRFIENAWASAGDVDATAVPICACLGHTPGCGRICAHDRNATPGNTLPTVKGGRQLRPDLWMARRGTQYGHILPRAVVCTQWSAEADSGPSLDTHNRTSPRHAVGQNAQ
jgi:hypothetical protein